MLLGTHNSGSYQFDFNVSFWGNDSKWEWLRKLAVLFTCVRNKIIDISKCQNLDIFRQLSMGVNLLDLRVSYANHTFYISHTFCCVPLVTVLSDIVKFLECDVSQNKITLTIFPDYNNRNTLIGKECILLLLIRRYLKKYMTKVSLYYEPIDIDLTYYHDFENTDDLNDIWFNVQSTEEFITNFNKTDFEGVDDLGCILSPSENISTLKDLLDLLNVSIYEYAKELNQIAISLLKERKKRNESLPKSCTFDYVEIVQEYLQLSIS